MTDTVGATGRSKPVAQPPRTVTLSSLLRLVLEMSATRTALIADNLTGAAKQFRLAFILTVVSAAGACLCIGFSGLAVLIYFWDSHRLAAAIALPGFLAILSIVAWTLASQRMRALPSAFDASVQTLRDDVKAVFGQVNGSE